MGSQTTQFLVQLSLIANLPSERSTTDTVTALHSFPCFRLMPSMANLSGNIEYVAVGKNIEVPLLLASLQRKHRIKITPQKVTTKTNILGI